MESRNLIPGARIASYIDRILIIECNHLTTDFNLPLYANGVPTLLFTSERGTMEKSVGDYLTLFGQTVMPKTLSLTKGFVLIAYFFKPYSLLSLFNVAAQELTDRPVDLKLLGLNGVAELQEKLLNADSIETMIILLDDFVSRLIANSRPDCAIIKYATTKIAANPSKEILVSLQKEMRITERTFQRNFEAKVGVAPNQFRRIHQFNSAFYQLLRKEYHKLSDIAFENGYTDQSHYIRAFKEFTGITPKEFLSYGA